MKFETPKTQEEIIVKATSLHFGLDVEHLTQGKETNKNAVYQRMVCIYLIKENTLISHKNAGVIFGMPESTAKNGYYRVRDLLTVDRRTMNDIAEIKLIIDRFTAQKKKLYA